MVAELLELQKLAYLDSRKDGSAQATSPAHLARKTNLLSLVTNDCVDCFTAGDATHASREKIDLGLSGLLSK